MWVSIVRDRDKFKSSNGSTASQKCEDVKKCEDRSFYVK